jgi:hypothetical protein
MTTWTADSGSITADSSGATADGSVSSIALAAYPSRILSTWLSPNGIAGIAGILPYGEFFEAVGDSLIYGIDWNGALANYWQRGGTVPANTTVRPHAPNGFQFNTVLGGQSGSAEPTWPAIIGQTVTDGSVVWVCEAIDTTSLSATAQSAQWRVPTGITVDGQEIAGQLTIALLDASQAVVGQNYTINVQTTMSDGEVKTGRIVIKVR